MVKVTLYALTLICFAPLAVFAQAQPGQSPQTATDNILAASEHHFRKGESCFAAGDMECARREFDLAIDTVLESGIDMRSDKRLYQRWREVIEQINQYQLAAINSEASVGWKMQEFNGLPPIESAEMVEIEDDDTSHGPLTPGEFQKKFAELQQRFREKYDRDITLTGADHGEHRRLYGRGSAYDLRVRDLSREQVRFIVATGSKLGLRIKDFSTWEKVAAHNARVLQLGRPLDTMATGLHLHIDRMTKKKRYNARPASKIKQRGKQ